ncbi:unnamed protein product [Prorocentrum cordatum]|uniref:Uncharacterized protein n=1 Tax=Prorocentrum cordatum TaxID=2364126 RepID=A0ABN9SKJ6_9DINO|nr:unnamed protein product [Polarella glacialis]
MPVYADLPVVNLVDPTFPDFGIDDLKIRASHFILETAAFAAWGTTPTESLPEDARASAWRVPEAIVKLIPEAVQQILRCTDGQPLVVLRNFDFVDICAGSARITRWCTWAGLQGCALDRLYGRHMDINADAGMALAILAILRVREHGLVFIAAQCSSWVWVSRSSTGRSKANVMGNAAAPSVIESNILNCRCAVLCLLCAAIGVYWVIEQPGTSLFFQTAEMQHVMLNTGARLVKFYMSSYGHPSCKDTILVGTAPWLPQIAFGSASLTYSSATPKAKPRPRSQPKKADQVRGTAKLTTEVVKHGKKKVTGNKPYPIGSCRPVSLGAYSD